MPGIPSLLSGMCGWLILLQLGAQSGTIAYQLLPHHYSRDYADLCIRIHPDVPWSRRVTRDAVVTASERWNRIPGNGFRVGLYESPWVAVPTTLSCVHIAPTHADKGDAPGLTVHNVRKPESIVRTVQVYLQTDRIPDLTTFRNVLLHEFGHVHLLDHSDPETMVAMFDPARELPIMAVYGRMHASGDTLAPEPPRDIRIDDIAGILALHSVDS